MKIKVQYSILVLTFYEVLLHTIKKMGVEFTISDSAFLFAVCIRMLRKLILTVVLAALYAGDPPQLGGSLFTIFCFLVNICDCQHV